MHVQSTEFGKGLGLPFGDSHLDGIKAVITIWNFGQSPAYNVSIRRKEKTVPLTEIDSFPTSLAGKKFTGPATIGPGTGLTLSIDNILTREEYWALKAEAAYTFFLGEIIWDDVLKRVGVPNIASELITSAQTGSGRSLTAPPTEPIEKVKANIAATTPLITRAALHFRLVAFDT